MPIAPAAAPTTPLPSNPATVRMATLPIPGPKPNREPATTARWTPERPTLAADCANLLFFKPLKAALAPVFSLLPIPDNAAFPTWIPLDAIVDTALATPLIAPFPAFPTPPNNLPKDAVRPLPIFKNAPAIFDNSGFRNRPATPKALIKAPRSPPPPDPPPPFRASGSFILSYFGRLDFRRRRDISSYKEL